MTRAGGAEYCNRLYGRSRCCLDCSKIGRVGNGTVDVVELDLVAISKLNQVQATGRVVEPVLVDIIDIGIPAFLGVFW